MRVFLASLGVLVLGGCVNLAPDYTRPTLPVPTNWPTIGNRVAYPRTKETGSVSRPGSKSDRVPVALLGWRDFLKDERLQKVVAVALANNRDLRQAALDIETARQRYRIAGSALFPTVDASVDAEFSRGSSGSSNGTTFNNGNGLNGTTFSSSGSGGNGGNVDTRTAVQLGFASFELDFFGALRNDKQATLEALRASAELRQSAQISLIAEAAIGWLTLAADRQRLAIARDTLVNQRNNLALVRKRHQYGIASGIDVANARSTVETARGDVAGFVTAVAQDRNALRLVAGSGVPDVLLPPVGVPDDAVMQRLPTGIASQVLLTRPDVRAAEYILRSDNANIGAARAAFFPTVSLTASTGWASSGLSSLFEDRNRRWSFSPRITLPIFNAGANRANLEIARTQRRIDLAAYEQAIQTAFREVADALAGRATIDERLAAQRALVAANRRAYRLSLARYRVGTDSFLDTLVAQRALYEARLGLVDRGLSAQSNLVTLYKVLGGGAVAGPVTADPAQTGSGATRAGR